jgi:hypothetical protein
MFGNANKCKQKSVQENRVSGERHDRRRGQSPEE